MGQTDLVLYQMRALLAPPPKQRLSQWIEREVILPQGVTALSGPVRLWPFQREIADAIGDPLIERVTLVKPVRVGFTTLLTSAVASFVANDPSPILCVLPTESDCRDYVVSDIEPIFAASPILAKALSDDNDPDGRNTLMSRRFPGGSLKVVAAKAPRNLRRHNARVLFMDEVDGMEPTAEGSPILLAERRTFSFPDRKIVLGSTPVHDETSNVLHAYRQSDQRVYECPCPECGTFAEILWEHIVWDEDRPETARFQCPHCKTEVTERQKLGMVSAGAWRATRPDVVGHAGFRMNALISLLANASWGKLAQEFLAVKSDPGNLQTFVNTILGQGWKSDGEEMDEGALQARAEPFGLDNVPADALVVTVGVDVQHDRLEATFLGWTVDGVALVLGHRVIWGQWDSEQTWAELDGMLKETFPHDLGGRIGVDAVAIDAGDGTTMEKVIAFCRPRTARKVLAIKGAAGNRPMIERSNSKTKTGGRLWIVGVDTGKTRLFARLGQGSMFRFSADLPAVWFEQVTSERAVVRYSKGQPTRSFQRIPGRRAEGLDCLIYAIAARQVVTVVMDDRRHALTQATPVAAFKAAPKPGGWIKPRDKWL